MWLLRLKSCAACAPGVCVACACIGSHVLFIHCRKHLKRDSPSAGPPQDTEDLFRLLKQAAKKFNAPDSTVTARKSRRPGKTCFFLFTLSYTICTRKKRKAYSVRRYNLCRAFVEPLYPDATRVAMLQQQAYAALALSSCTSILKMISACIG